MSYSTTDAGSHQRGVGETEKRSLELRVLVGPNGVHRFGERDQVLLAGSEIHYPDLANPASPLVDHQVGSKRVGPVHLDVRTVGQQPAPACLRAGGQPAPATRRKLGAASLVVMKKRSPWCSTLYSTPNSPRLYHAEHPFRLVGVEEPDFGRRVTRDVEKQVSPASGAIDVQEEGFVRFEVDQDVCRGTGANGVAVEPAGPASMVQQV